MPPPVLDHLWTQNGIMFPDIAEYKLGTYIDHGRSKTGVWNFQITWQKLTTNFSEYYLSVPVCGAMCRTDVTAATVFELTHWRLLRLPAAAPHTTAQDRTRHKTGLSHRPSSLSRDYIIPWSDVKRNIMFLFYFLNFQRCSSKIINLDLKFWLYDTFSLEPAPKVWNPKSRSQTMDLSISYSYWFSHVFPLVEGFGYLRPQNQSLRKKLV